MNINIWYVICIELIIYILLFVIIRYFRMKCANYLLIILFIFFGLLIRNFIFFFFLGNINCNMYKVGRWKKILKMVLVCIRK